MVTSNLSKFQWWMSTEYKQVKKNGMETGLRPTREKKVIVHWSIYGWLFWCWNSELNKLVIQWRVFNRCKSKLNMWVILRWLWAVGETSKSKNLLTKPQTKTWKKTRKKHSCGHNTISRNLKQVKNGRYSGNISIFTFHITAADRILEPQNNMHCVDSTEAEH